MSSISGYITWVNDGAEAWTMRAPGMLCLLFACRQSRHRLICSHGSKRPSDGWPTFDLGGTDVYNHQSRNLREFRCCRVSHLVGVTKGANGSYDGLEALWPVQ